LRQLLPIAAFELGNMATTLLILRATTLLHAGGRSAAAATSLAVLIYAGHNLFGSLVAFGGGHWIDRAGPRVVFATAAALYVVSYGLLAVPGTGWILLVAAFLLAGSGIGLAETAESALVARLLPDHLRGKRLRDPRRRPVVRGLRLLRSRRGPVDHGVPHPHLRLRGRLHGDRGRHGAAARNDGDRWSGIESPGTAVVARRQGSSEP
jgi:hypothetical protein